MRIMRHVQAFICGQRYYKRIIISYKIYLYTVKSTVEYQQKE